MNREFDWKAMFDYLAPRVTNGGAKTEEARLLLELGLCQRDDQSGAKWVEALANLAALYFATGKFKAANLMIKSALTRIGQERGGYHLEVSKALCALAETCMEKGEYHRIAPILLHTNINLRKHYSGRRSPSRLNSMLSEAQAVSSQAGKELEEVALEV